MKKFCAIFITVGLSGCTLTDNEQTEIVEQPVEPVVEEVAKECVFIESAALTDARCEIGFWLDYWAQVADLPWPQRLSLIESMGDSPVELLQKVILSQPVNTPYKARLRAQHWLEQLNPVLTENNQRRLFYIVAKPSEHMLEFESAVSLMSKVSNSKDKTIEMQDVQIKKLNAQLEALLNIESSLMHQEQEAQQ